MFRSTWLACLTPGSERQLHVTQVPVPGAGSSRNPSVLIGWFSPWALGSHSDTAQLGQLNLPVLVP